jgi:1-acyl-sn-glycerol-3-phosphate acyltransferase
MQRAFAQACRGLLVASAFFFFWAGAVFLSWTVCPVLGIVYREEAARWRACQRIVNRAFWLFHAYMRVLALVEIRVAPGAGENSARPAGPCVVVANHPTLVDVTAILASFENVVCVVKSSLMNNFFVGRLLRCSGHVDGGGNEAMAGAILVQEAQRRLDAGFAVLIFPEGTRSPPGGMHPFRRGAFEVARRAAVPLWPLFLTCNPSALSKGVPVWKHPAKMARIRIHPTDAVPAGSFDARACCVEVERLLRECLKGAPPAPASAPALADSKAAGSVLAPGAAES